MTTYTVTLELSPRQRTNLMLALSLAIEAAQTYQRYSPKSHFDFYQEQIDETDVLLDAVNAAPTKER